MRVDAIYDFLGKKTPVTHNLDQTRMNEHLGRVSKSAGFCRQALLLALLISCLGWAACSTGDGSPDTLQPTSGIILSAFFGLDNSLPLGANLLCPGSFRLDGMPVIFSKRVVPDRVTPEAFRVLTAAGKNCRPLCATTWPATGPSELHTVLLLGELGDDGIDPPARLEIVGTLSFQDGTDAFGLSTSAVTPLSEGPRLVLALRYELAGLPASSCDPARTRQIVQVTFQGGVKALDGRELGDEERQRFTITVLDRSGSTREIVPFALADLNDMDNYIHLCLDTDARPLSIYLPADTVIDPNGDPNPDTLLNVIDGE
jgi:hypothetical protein